MKTKRILILIILTLVLVSCNADYGNALSSYEVAYAGRAVLFSDAGMRWLGEDAILEFSDHELPFLIDFAVARSNDAKNIDEIGVFKTEAEHREETFEIVSRYLENKQDSYRAMNYFPGEREKIECATVRCFGNYVVYSFLSEKDTDLFYSAVVQALRK